MIEEDDEKVIFAVSLEKEWSENFDRKYDYKSAEFSAIVFVISYMFEYCDLWLGEEGWGYEGGRRNRCSKGNR